MKVRNKEIIIDGVNVAECDNYKSLFYEYRCGKCGKHPDCYFKQLARKKQKNIELEDLIKLMKEDEETYLQEYEKLLHTKDKLEEEKDLLTRELLSKMHEARQNNKCEQTIKDLTDKLNTAVNQYDKVVKQNASLQAELNEYKKLKDAALEPPLSLRDVLLMNCVESDVSSKYENDIRKRIVEFLEEMSSQDNRGTAFPYIYTIADEQENFEPDNGGDFFFDSNIDEVQKVSEVLSENYIEGNIEIDSDENFDDILESIGTPYEDDRIDDWLRNYEGKAVQRYSKEYKTYYEGTFFTESDAKEYLENTRNHHFGPNPRTYVDSMNKWGRHSKTEAFLVDLFNYFDVKVPPKMYYDKREKEKDNSEC